VGEGTSGRGSSGAVCSKGFRASDPRTQVAIGLAGLRFPPRDLAQTLPQQSLLLDAAREAAAGTILPKASHRGAQSGWDATRRSPGTSGRWRTPYPLDADVYTAELAASDVVGTMPNMIANRVNVQLDLAGPATASCAEQASGLVALRLAAGMLRSRECDAVLVGASDLSHEQVHRAALAAVAGDVPPGDAAVVMVLKRVGDARRDGDRILATLGAEAFQECSPQDPPGAERGAGPTIGPAADFDPTEMLGAPHAAVGLLAAACAIVALQARALPVAGAPHVPCSAWTGQTVRCEPLGGRPEAVQFTAADSEGLPQHAVGRLYLYRGADAEDVLDRLARGAQGRRRRRHHWPSTRCQPPKTACRPHGNGSWRQDPRPRGMASGIIPSAGRSPSSTPTAPPPIRPWAAGCCVRALT